MRNIGTQILTPMADTVKPASAMTHVLMTLGNGDMQQSLARIGHYFAAQSQYAMKVGRIQGIVFGCSAVYGINSIYLLLTDSQKNKKLSEEGQTILKCIRERIDNSETEHAERLWKVPSGMKNLKPTMHRNLSLHHLHQALHHDSQT